MTWLVVRRRLSPLGRHLATGFRWDRLTRVTTERDLALARKAGDEPRRDTSSCSTPCRPIQRQLGFGEKRGKPRAATLPRALRPVNSLSSAPHLGRERCAGGRRPARAPLPPWTNAAPGQLSSARRGPDRAPPGSLQSTPRTGRTARSAGLGPEHDARGTSPSRAYCIRTASRSRQSLQREYASQARHPLNQDAEHPDTLFYYADLCTLTTPVAGPSTTSAL